MDNMSDDKKLIIDPDADVIISDLATLKTDRSELNIELEEVAAFCCPEKSGFLSESTSKEKNTQPRHVICPEAVEANNIFKRGMFTNMCPPNSRWHNMEPEDEDLMETAVIKDFYGTANSLFYKLLMNSNFPLEINELFEDAGWCSTVNMSIEPDVERVFLFNNIPFSEYHFRENHHHERDTVYREFKLTAAQAVEKFAGSDDDLGKCEKLKEAAGDVKKQHNKFTFIHLVKPNKKREFDGKGKPKLGNKNKAWSSIYVCVEDKDIIRQSGYDEMPFTVARLEKKAGQIYGFGPGRSALRSIKIGNKIWATVLKAGEKAVDPPVNLNTAAYNTKGLSPQYFQNPGSVNLYDGTQPHMAPTFQQTPSNLPYGFELLDRTNKYIHAEFFVNMFQMINNLNQEGKGRQRTAYEISRLVGEGQTMIVPMTSRLLEEFFTPKLTKAWNIALAAGKLGVVPKELAGTKMKVTYTSPLALATRMSEINTFNDFMTIIAPLAELDETVMDHIDVDGAVKRIKTATGVHPDFTNNKVEVEKIRSDRQAAQAKAEKEAATLELAKSQNLNKKIEDGSAAANMGDAANE
jgi:Bacteriophage head to tail connecting protein